MLVRNGLLGGETQDDEEPQLIAGENLRIGPNIPDEGVPRRIPSPKTTEREKTDGEREKEAVERDKIRDFWESFRSDDLFAEKP